MSLDFNIVNNTDISSKKNSKTNEQSFFYKNNMEQLSKQSIETAVVVKITQLWYENQNQVPSVDGIAFRNIKNHKNLNVW